MRYTADLHTHSKYSRATAKDCDPSHLDLWARYKGLDLVGTGDFTHAKWREELRGALVPAEEGFYRLKEDYRLPASIGDETMMPQFVVTGEISSIYKKNGKTRKVHNVIILPSLEDGDKLAKRLEAIGNLHSDGRPILGLDCRDLLEITLETCPKAVFVPAHIWTPHFSLFGAFSGFDAIEECFEDLTPHIHALETGLSSDPPMNRRVSALDRFTLISNSDAHSPMKLAREANLFDCDFNYYSMARAIETGKGFDGTLEFFPEEGKYHWDGHRNCGRRFSPKETIALDGICPGCGKKITIGVDHRVEELADRDAPIPLDKPFERLMPLTEIIGDTLGVSAFSKKVQTQYFQMMEQLGAELDILRNVPIEAIESVAGICIAKSIEKLRKGDVKLTPGYDGEYGKISIFTPKELEELRGEQSLFAWDTMEQQAEAPVIFAGLPKMKKTKEKKNMRNSDKVSFNAEQQAAITAKESVVAVIAGPGTGKTRTLVERIAYLIESRGVSPKEITAVTFTNQAAAEMRKRLFKRLRGRFRKTLHGLTVGTFHRVCLDLLQPKPLIDQGDRQDLIRRIASDLELSDSPQLLAEAISRHKNGIKIDGEHWSQALYDAYQKVLSDMGCRDLDDILREALAMDPRGLERFHYLLIDEFQDINEVQRALAEHWSRQGELFVIGDSDQSIYGFRGASARCFKDLLEKHPETKVIRLKENYRSTPQVMESAIHVINKNGGMPRTLHTNIGDGEAVRAMRCHTPFSEAVWIAKEINTVCGGVDMLVADRVRTQDKRLEHGASRALKDIAVLCRTRKQLKLIENCLIHEGIPCVIQAREDFLKKDEVRGCLGFFRSLLDPRDTVSLAAGLRLSFHCPDDEVEEVLKRVKKMETWDVAHLSKTLGNFGKAMVWVKAVEIFAPMVISASAEDVIAAWVEYHGMTEAMDRLIHMALFHATMEDFLSALTLGEEGDLRRATGKDYGSDAVRLMTLHGAKGLEFPVVFLAGLDRGTLPLERESMTTDVEEERRLFFVGITRAKESLTITSGGAPSTFLTELPPTVRFDEAKAYAPQEEEPSLFANDKTDEK